MRLWFLTLMSGLLFFLSCWGGKVISSVQAEALSITQAQSQLPTVDLSITTRDGKVRHFTVEVARTEQQQETGEMFRKSLEVDHGMLFLWQVPHESDMWMHNTYVPLDMVFIDMQHRIHAIEENTVPLSEAVIRSHGVVGSVLELPAGTTERLGIVVGDQVSSAAF